MKLNKHLETKMAAERKLYDLNISKYENLPTPRKILSSYPLLNGSEKTVSRSREEIKVILRKKDKRKVIIVGPCSIHDIEGGLEYAAKLTKLAYETRDKLLLVMRTYFEKPRTSLGWEGFIKDPNLDGSYDISKGIKESRKFLIDVTSMGIPCACEFVSTNLPQYIADLISWAAIGARTVESQAHRALASGLSMPVGFKNSTSGDIESVVNAAFVARNKRKFEGMDLDGRIGIVTTRGNKYTHVVLRGGNGHPNYSPKEVRRVLKLMENAEIAKNIIIDCSHGNSDKDYEKQEEVAYKVLDQMRTNPNIIGIMLESNLFGDKQDFPKTKKERKSLKQGVSITDACISFDTTERIVRSYSEII